MIDHRLALNVKTANPVDNFIAGKQAKNALALQQAEIDRIPLKNEINQVNLDTAKNALAESKQLAEIRDDAIAAMETQSLLQNPEAAMGYLGNRISSIGDGDSSGEQMVFDMIRTGNIEQANAALETIVSQARSVGAIKGAGLSASQQEFNSLVDTAGLNDEDSARAARVKLGLDPRASISAAERIASDPDTTAAVADSKAEIAGAEALAKETSKLSAQLKLKPEVEAAVDRAVKIAEAEVTLLGDKRSNETALRLYETAMGGLADALGDTTTGPFLGRMPSITSNQQIADGAIAAMAPILKQMFRAAGEGQFTDRDQQLLLDMVPTRTDRADARLAKMQNIDAIVKAKLNIQPPAQENLSDLSDDELLNF